jgi:hypothetical protein
LLGDVHEGVDDAVGNLPRWQREGLARIENREAREEQRVEEGQLVIARAPRHHRAAVHLRSGRRQRQDTAEGDRALHPGAPGEDVPGVADEGYGGGDEFRAVDHRAAADGEQEVDLLATREVHGLHQRLVGRVRFDAGKLEQCEALERRGHFVERAGADHAAAPVGDQDARAGGNLAGNIGDTSLAEEDARRIVER